MSEPKWVAAKALAEQGYALAKESKDAEKSGDTALYQSKAAEALAKFDKALEDTAVWEDTLVEDKIAVEAVHNNISAQTFTANRYMAAREPVPQCAHAGAGGPHELRLLPQEWQGGWPRLGPGPLR